MNKGILFLILGLLFIFSSASRADEGAITNDEALEKFVKANFAYKDERYQDATSEYEDIVRSGWESGPVYYNLANSYYKNGKLGKALLNYERALQLNPRDHDLKANFAYSLSLVTKSYSIPPKRFWQRWLDIHMAFYSLDEMAIVMLIIVFLIATVHLLSLYLYWAKQQFVPIIVVLCVFFVIFAAGFIAKLQYQQDLSVVLADTHAKFEPRDDATIHFELYEGGNVRFLKREGLWVKIQRLDGKIGWVPLETVERI